MIKTLLLLFVLAGTLGACNMIEKKDSSTETKKKKKIAEEDDEIPKQKKKKPAVDDLETNSDAEILNNIIVHETGGLKISRAFLAYEDGSLVFKTNHTEIGKPVYLNLLVKKGWKVDEGMVSIDASEKIVSDAGEVALNATNLFNTTPKVKEDDAKIISLKAAITKTRKSIDYFIVNYRVWDKLGDGEVKGSYKLHVGEQAE